jgi:hypothetical protein
MPCDGIEGADRDPACFTVRQDDSSRIVTRESAECTCGASGSKHRTSAVPANADEALRLAIKLAVDAGEFERASALLEVINSTVPKEATVAPLSAWRTPRER